MFNTSDIDLRRGLETTDKVLIILVVGVLILSAITIAFGLNKHFTLDEAIPFAWNAHLVAQNGITYYGERVEPGSDETVLEIAHPPLYNLILALSFKLLGESNVTGRLIGVICMLMTSVLILMILSNMYAMRIAYRLWSVFLILFLVNPYVLQYALLIDIDTSVLTLLLVLTTYCYIVFMTSNDKRFLILTGFSLGLSFWAKEMTPPIFVFAVFLCHALEKKVKDAVILSLVITLISLFFFIVTWLSFCEYTNTPSLSFIKFTILNKGMRSIPFAYPLIIIFMVKQFLFWLSLPIVILLCVALKNWLNQIIRGRSIRPVNFLFIFMLLMLFYATIYIPTSTSLTLLKYAYPASPFAALIIAQLLYEKCERLKYQHLVAAVIIICVTLLFFRLVDMENPLILVYGRDFHFFSRFSILYMTPILFTFLNIVYFLRKANIGKRMLYSVILSILPYCIHQNTLHWDSLTTSLSWSNYGERGLSSTIRYLSGALQDKDKVIARKDIGYYINHRIGFDDVEWFYPVFRGTPEEMERNLTDILAYNKVEYIVIEKHSNPSVSIKIIEPYFDLIKQYDDFYIYEKSADIRNRSFQ